MMGERKVSVRELSVGDPLRAADDDVALLTEEEVLYGLTVARTAELLFGISENYVRQLRARGEIVGTGRKGRYTALSVLKARKARKRAAGQTAA